MAVADQIVLSSSPIRQDTLTTPLSVPQDAASSSPGLPSPSQLLMGKAVRLASGSAAVLVPQNAYIGLTSASGLLRPAESDDRTVPKVTDARFILKAKAILKGLESKPLAPVGKGQKDRQGKGRSEPQKRIRKSTGGGKSKGSPITVIVKASVKDGEEGRSGGIKHSKQSRKEEQAKIKKAKVTKPGAFTAGSKRCEGKATEDRSDKSGVELQKADTGEAKDSLAATNEDDLGLTEALKRRKDWTPAKKPFDKTISSGETEASWFALVPSVPPSNITLPHTGFGKLVEDFGYAEAKCATVTKPIGTRSVSGECGTKRRKLDLVAGVAPLPAKGKAAPVKRNRSPKKKPQTITDKATAPFVPEDHALTSIRDYFASSPVNTNLHSPRCVPEVRRKKAEDSMVGVPAKKVIKNSKVKTKVTKETRPPVVLVSPEFAMKAVKEQDLLFGTSSQLVREESPTFIRHLQQAVKASEIVDEPPALSREMESQTSLQSTASKLSNSRLPTASRNLWSAAARDGAGSLLNVDVVNLLDTPQPTRSLPSQVRQPRDTEVTEAPVEPTDAATDGGWKSIDDEARDKLPVSSADTLLEGKNPILRSVAEASLRERPRSESPIKKQRKRKDSKTSSAETSLTETPNYSGFTDADLKKEVAAFGFKPIRRRGEMIALLETCWKSRKRIALQALPPNVPGTLAPAKDLQKAASRSSSPTKSGSLTKNLGRPRKGKTAEPDNNVLQIQTITSPKKPRGGPKKSTATQASSSKPQTETPMEDISDTGFAPPAPSPRRRATTKRPGPLTLTTSVSATAAVQNVEALFATITKAITSYPPTNDAKNLTWYEKMLLYDPIVLEDLADWLNKEGFSLVGCEDKVTPGMTKRWCESQSICCVWKENLKGGTRARH